MVAFLVEKHGIAEETANEIAGAALGCCPERDDAGNVVFAKKDGEVVILIPWEEVDLVRHPPLPRQGAS